MIYDVRGLRFAYPTADRAVLADASLTLGEGEILTVLGPNGSGKSTLLGCMLGLLKPQAGEVRLCGQPLASLGARRIATLAGYVRQSQPATFGYSVADFVLMGRAPLLGVLRHPGAADREAAAAAMRELGIEALAGKSVSELSGGELQQAMIARAIVGAPRVLLLDEPTAHLDYGNQLRVLRMLKRLSEAGYALVITTHNPEHALLLGGKAALLDRHGRLRVGASGALLTEANLRDVYDTELRLCYQPEVDRVVCIYPNLGGELP